MGGAEAVEEMQERHPALDGEQMGDGAEIHDLLHACLLYTSDQLGIGGLAAARAGARELEQGLAELAALDLSLIHI